MLPARAKSVIYLHMAGAPSQVDLFEYKPALIKFSGQPCPKEYLEGKRFAFIKAQELLETTRSSVKEIMVRVGVNDQSHFVRDFKRVCGCTPVRYRMRCLAERFVNREEVRGSQ